MSGGSIRFGELKPGSLSVASYNIVLEEAEGYIHYKRYGPGGLEASSKVFPGMEIGLYPHPPLTIVEGVPLDCVYLSLSDTLIVPPGGIQKVEVGLPFDVVVTVYDGSNYIAIDQFTLPGAPVKMALYGDPNDGEICRYFRVGEPRGSVARCELHVINGSGETARVSRVVMPRAGLYMYYNDEGVVVGPSIVMTVRGPRTAEVHLEAVDPGPGFRRAPLVSRERRLLELGARKKSMMWGY